jgi:hypothetical protein
MIFFNGWCDEQVECGGMPRAWATACLVGPGVILMTFCAAILPWLSYGDKDHVILLFFDKHVSFSLGNFFFI